METPILKTSKLTSENNLRLWIKARSQDTTNQNWLLICLKQDGNFRKSKNHSETIIHMMWTSSETKKFIQEHRN